MTIDAKNANKTQTSYGEFLRGKIAVAKYFGCEVDEADIHPILKPFQRQVVAWAVKGGRRALFESFGLGKTMQQLEVLRLLTEHSGARALVIAPLGVRQEFTRDAAKLGLQIKFIRSIDETDAQGLYITNYETVRDGKLDPNEFQAVSLDEASCFPKGTLIDCPNGKIPIDKIRLGDVIYNAGGKDHVRALHKNHVKRVARINFKGHSILASCDHRFFTTRGWVVAEELQSGDSLVETAQAMRLLREGNTSPVFRGSNEALLQSILLSEMAGNTTRGKEASVRSAEEAKQNIGQLAETSKLPELRCNYNPTIFSGREQKVLQPEMLFDLARDEASAHAGNQGKTREETLAMVARGRSIGEAPTKENGRVEADVESLKCGENEESAYWEDVLVTGREQQAYEPAKASICGFSRCPNGISNRNGIGEKLIPVTSKLLQSRYSDTRKEDGYRGRWEQSQIKEVAISRQAQDEGIGCSWVVSVEILESGHPDLDGYRDADGELYFYDLSATRHPSYSVKGLLVHNCLRSFGSLTYQRFLTLFDQVPYRFVCTATPSPNRYKELIHYGGFLGIMDTGQALTRFFQRDSQKANHLTLYPHMEREFWLWLASWACFVNKPSDLGDSDEGYDLPPLQVHYHEIPVDHSTAGVDRDGQRLMFRNSAFGLSEAAREKRDSMSGRIAKMAEIIAADPESHYVIWHDLEDERRAIKRAIPEAVEVYGSLDLEIRESRVIAFSEGEIKYLASKPRLSGSGCNFQRHCHKAIFLGVGYKFNDWIQSIHRIHRFLQDRPCEIHIIYAESERTILEVLKQKWAQHDRMVERMSGIIKKHGLNSLSGVEVLTRTIGIERKEQKGANWTAVNNDCILECQELPEKSVDLIVTSIPFSNHYEYTPAYEDFGHSQGDDHFFEQMDYLTPELLRILKPGRVACIHTKDRILFGNVTGKGMPTVNPFHCKCIFHYQQHGFAYMGMITVVTDVVRENNQTYRLGWSEQCKDGTKMGCGGPEYILLFRRLPSDTSKGYADNPVSKPKSEYSRSRWQTDAHAFWRSNGNRLLTPEEIAAYPPDVLSRLFTESTLGEIYDYERHVAIGEALDRDGHLPATFMCLAPGSHHPDVWTDICRMRTLNGEQSRRKLALHVCPLQLDLIERLIRRYSSEGELVFDPFAGLMSVPFVALKLRRKGYGVELNPGYFLDGARYLTGLERKLSAPTLFDFEKLTEASL